MKTTVKLTGALEDYLEAIYIIEKSKDEVRITDIALFMEISKPSVNKAVENLRRNGLLEHEKYGCIKLTSAGRKVASEVYFRHEMLTNFLVNTLGIDRNIAEQDACKMEHIVSHETLYKLIDYMKSNSSV